MFDVEQALREVRAAYESLTGQALQARPTELPADVDPWAHLTLRYRQFQGLWGPMSKEAQAHRAGQAESITGVWAPPIDVIESTLETSPASKREPAPSSIHELRIEIDLPAVTRDQVALSVDRDHLVVRGRRAGAVAPGGTVRHAERPIGPFQRLIPLPAQHRGAHRDGQSIEATLREGVLVVLLRTPVTQAPVPPGEGSTAGPPPGEIRIPVT